MYSTSILLATLTGLVVAQDTTFKNGTGVRSLWIPFQTISGTPLASLGSVNPSSNATEYVLSCPTASPQCAFAPNLTLTEGVGSARYVTSNSQGAATVVCTYTGTETATCSQGILDSNSNIIRTETTISGSMIAFQAVQVTATQNITSTSSGTAGAKTTSGASSSATSTSSAGVAGQSAVAAPWAMGGALGAGLMAIAAL
ncbi:hypothetical protein LTR78_005202 [Recurvomyces mirabilis]|uniref:GPI anchored protein n=1 Tax=Recurvomyces mirabilis TaxID=574656 RepID=A0AAE0WNB0_9PEZI|nr:hypothetical protein LTR78_005202 [Recurvomyces mirabilis]KAK5157752.1 hypothetical protein LTS14_003674 [Recurvomyces mirabilis]